MSQSTTTPIPIILCGKNPTVGRLVTESLKPEYAVAEFISSVEQGLRGIPKLLSDPSGPTAVVLGGGYDDAAVKQLREGVESSDIATRKVPWCRSDLQKRAVKAPSNKEEADGEIGRAYARDNAEGVKKLLAELERDGKLKGEFGDVVFF